jgi:pimeloyl-ACP methyl ester carboxylesterase
LNYYRAANAGPPANGEKPGPAPAAAAPGSLIVKVPTLVIWGEKDTALLISSLDGLEKFVTTLTIKRIPDGTHWVIHEKPELVNQHIREFIR